jgi:hypothetical protein
MLIWRLPHVAYKKKSHGWRLGKKNARIGNNMCWKDIAALEVQNPNEKKIY